MDSGKFFVLWPDGQRFGPADVPTLNAWIAENRINRNSSVEPESNPGQILPLESVPGIVFPEPVPSPQPAEPEAASPATPSVSASDLNDPFKQQSSGASTTSGGYDPVSPSGTTSSQPSSPTYSSPYNPGSYQSSQPQQQQPQQYANYPRQQGQSDDGQSDITLSFVFTGVGLVVLIGTVFVACPMVGAIFSIVGIVFASKAAKVHHPSAKGASIFAWIVTVLGLLAQLGVVIFAFAIMQQLPG